MTENERAEKTERLKTIIKDEAIAKTEHGAKIVQPDGLEATNAWLIDLRAIFLKTEPLNLIVDLFWYYMEKEFPFQVGGQEIAAIPLVAAIAARGRDGKPVNGFVIRKSRKWIGLQKMIEGTLDDTNVVLVDDLTNSGGTLKRQIEIIEREGKRVSAVFVLVRYREEGYYDFLKERGIRLISLFTLGDFGLDFPEHDPLPRNIFKVIWHHEGVNPTYFSRIPKSAPVLDDNNIYFGTDNCEFLALSQETGSILWRFKVGKALYGKSIFSTPALWKDSVYFGSYDGNFYCLNKNTGALQWAFDEADWVGSSPAVAPDLGLVFVGLEFGFINKKGGIAALDLKTGKKKWEFRMPQYAHSSPAYCKEKKAVVIGSNDNKVYCFDAAPGTLRWKFATQGPVKSSFAFAPEANLVTFGSFDHCFYALDIATGEKKGSFMAENVFYTTPLISGDNVYIGSTDKRLYSFNLKTGAMNWTVSTEGRIFANPVVIDGSVYIGATNGVLYEINCATGKITGLFQALERITNRIAYNPETKRIFLPTYANEIYCLEKTV